jgi:hypothetical protein
MTAEEERAIEVLAQISRLAQSLYPWRPSAKLNPVLPYALGQIRWIAEGAITRVHDLTPDNEK